MDTHQDAGGRAYRVTEMLMNGSAVLDAEDLIPAHHRRFVEALLLPAGAVMGATLRRYDDGRIELAHELVEPDAHTVWPADESQGTVVQFSPTFGGIVHATVVTVAREFDLSLYIAAHIIHSWIKVEYLM